MPAGGLAHGRVVAAVYSPATLRAALALGPAPAAPDWLELRVDGFHEYPGELDALVTAAPRPFVVTVRHPAEGGAAGAPADPAARRRLYERFLARPGVAAVDVEVRSWNDMLPVLQTTWDTNILAVASFHDFTGVPAVGQLRGLARLAVQSGADVCKVAATVERPGQLARLLDFMEWGQDEGISLAVMGMGPLGRVSRLALAAAGSALNYGYLGDAGPQVPGQWPATTLRERIEECGGGLSHLFVSGQRIHPA